MRGVAASGHYGAADAGRGGFPGSQQDIEKCSYNLNCKNIRCTLKHDTLDEKSPANYTSVSLPNPTNPQNAESAEI